jgi:hypothetical protein
MPGAAARPVTRVASGTGRGGSGPPASRRGAPGTRGIPAPGMAPGACFLIPRRDPAGVRHPPLARAVLCERGDV